MVAKYIAQNIPNVIGNGKDFLYPHEEDEDACHLIDEFLSQWYPASDRYYDFLRAGSLEETKRCQKEFFNALTSLEKILNDNAQEEGNFLLGKHFSLAECISAPWVQRFYVTLPYFRNLDFENEMERMNLNRVSNWMKSVCERPSVVGSKCPEDEMIIAAKKYYVSYITPGAKGTL